DCDIAGGKFGCLKRADDLEARWIAETDEDAPGLALGARGQHPRLCRCDRAWILDLVGSYLSVPGGSVGEVDRVRPNAYLVRWPSTLQVRPGTTTVRP